MGSYNNQVCKFILSWTSRHTKLVLAGLLILLDMTAPKMFQPAYIHPCKWEYLATYCKNPSKTFPNAVCKSRFLPKLKGFSKKQTNRHVDAFMILCDTMIIIPVLLVVDKGAV